MPVPKIEHAELDVSSVSDGFLVVDENRSAVGAVEAVVSSLENGLRPPFSPLVIHGGSGTGKTHLVSGVVSRIVASQLETTVRIVSAGGTSWEVDGAGSLSPDLDLAACDLLVIEDIQHLPVRVADLAGDLMERRASLGRAVVATCSPGPAALDHLPRRLTSRLTAGLVVQMGSLGPASKRLIVAATAERQNLLLTAEAIDWLVQRGSGGGMRSLMGLVQTLVPAGLKIPLTVPEVKEVLVGAGHALPNGPGIPEVVVRVAAVFGVTQKEILGTSRLPGIMQARHVAMYLGRRVCRLSLPRLGVAFGGRDHTTVLHACRKIEGRIDVDPKLACLIRQLETELGLES